MYDIEEILKKFKYQSKNFVSEGLLLTLGLVGISESREMKHTNLNYYLKFNDINEFIIPESKTHTHSEKQDNEKIEESLAIISVTADIFTSNINI